MTAKTGQHGMDDLNNLGEDFVHLARLALVGRDQDVPLFLQRIARRYRTKAPEFADQLKNVLRQGSIHASSLRRSASPLPVDTENRLSLADVEWPNIDNDNGPILSEYPMSQIRQLVEERQKVDSLIAANLYATRTSLLVGPPGVGKTLAARWIAAQLQLPLIVLDLSSVMSSLLGRTGVNVRHVIDYAKQQSCVLLLDEIDAIGKRRDDPSDIGELKRLVTVLLQQIDQWPAHAGLLLAATNHPGLLDPAIWRRFEVVVEFALPGLEERQLAIHRFAGQHLDHRFVYAVAIGLDGHSFGEIESILTRCRRAEALGHGTLVSCLGEEIKRKVRVLDQQHRRAIAAELVLGGQLSQRQAYEFTGISRDTIRKLVKEKEMGVG